MQSRKHRQCTESLYVYQRDFNLVAPNTKEPQIQLESYARRAYWDSLLSTLRLFLSFYGENPETLLSPTVAVLKRNRMKLFLAIFRFTKNNSAPLRELIEQNTYPLFHAVIQLIFDMKHQIAHVFSNNDSFSF